MATGSRHGCERLYMEVQTGLLAEPGGAAGRRPDSLPNRAPWRSGGVSRMWNYVAVAMGGVVGCCARYGVTQAVHAVYGRNFPLATLIINVLGCLAMGFLFFATL